VRSSRDVRAVVREAVWLAAAGALLLASCGEPEAPVVRAGPQASAVGDRVGDVVEDAEIGGPVDQERVDLERVSVRRSGGQLEVTFDTIEQPGDAQVEQFVAVGPQGGRRSTIRAIFDDRPGAEATYRPPEGPQRAVEVIGRGSEVTVTVPLDRVTEAPSFRWQAKVISTRGKDELVDHAPDGEREWVEFAGR